MPRPNLPSCPRNGLPFLIGTVAVAFVLLLVAGAELRAQLETTNWYFGEQAGITFRNGFVEPLSDGMIVTNEGCAAISDPTTGDLLFYTDGVTVYNRIHEVMVGGTGLNGDASTSQSAIIVPQPGNPFVFYIFNPAPVTSSQLNGRCYCLWMSVVDLRKQGGFGEVVRKNEQIATDITEQVTATKDCGGDGYWIVVHSRSSRHFYAFHLTRDQFTSTPVISDAGDPLLSVRDAGQMHISPDSRKLVLTSAAGNSQLFEFDYATGLITNGTTLFPASIAGAHYGAAFSQDSRKLYIAVSNQDDTTPTVVYQFHLDQTRAIDIVASRKEAARLKGTMAWTPMQLALDGRIYIGRPNRAMLSCIMRPNNDVDSCDYVDSVVALTGTCRLGLPNFIGSFIRPPDVVLRDCKAPKAIFSTDSLCAGTCTTFTDNSTGTIDSWEWLFDGGMPATSTMKDPGSVCYAKSGLFNVYLIIKNQYGSDTAVRTVHVLPRPPVTVDPAPTVCTGSAVVLQARGGVRYEWSPADQVSDPTSATPTVSPTSTTRYVVTAYGANGCSDTASVIVRVAVPSAGPDEQICAGGSVRIKARDAVTYQWDPPTGLSNATVAEPIASPSRTTVYTVRMLNGACDVTDTVVVTVVDSLRPTVTGVTTICDGMTTSVSVSGGSSILWDDQPGISDRTSFTPTLSPTTTTTFRFTVTSGSCTARDSLIVTVGAMPACTASGSSTICLGDTVNVSVATDATATVRWSPAIGVSDTTSRTPRIAPLRTTTYYVTARTLLGCERVDSVVIRVDDLARVSAGPDKYSCGGSSVQLSATGSAAVYRWSPTTGLSDPNILAPIATPSQTTTYVLTASTGSCIATDTVTVVVSAFAIDVKPVDTVCAGSGVELRAQGAVRYTWSPTTGLSDPSIGNPVASPLQTTTYTVRGIDKYDCVDEKNVTVVVRPGTPIKLRLGIVHAQAGSETAPMDIYVDVDESMLPLRIDSLIGEIRFDASIFLPTSIDKGKMQTGVQANDRVIFFGIGNIDVLIPSQRLATIDGTILLGANDTASTRWVNSAWTGNMCPVVRPIDGFIFVTGCFLQGRVFREYLMATMTVRTDAAFDALAINIAGTEIGEHTIRLVAADGRVVWSTTYTRTNADPATMHINADCSSVANGVYVVQFEHPMGNQSTPIVLIR